jgi:hypothetical protein
MRSPKKIGGSQRELQKQGIIIVGSRAENSEARDSPKIIVLLLGVSFWNVRSHFMSTINGGHLQASAICKKKI